MYFLFSKLMAGDLDRLMICSGEPCSLQGALASEVPVSKVLSCSWGYSLDKAKVNSLGPPSTQRVLPRDELLWGHVVLLQESVAIFLDSHYLF